VTQPNWQIKNNMVALLTGGSGCRAKASKNPEKSNYKMIKRKTAVWGRNGEWGEKKKKKKS
jgi:hypothetical protein